MKKIVVILPTYNEKNNIEELVKEIQFVFKKLIKYDCHILVVDDNSPDNTALIIEQLLNKNKQIHLLTGSKKGLGFAYVRGMRHAINNLKAEIIFEMDADFSHDPKLIPLFVKEIEKGSDFVIGSRYIKGGSIPKNWGIERKFFSIFGNLIARFGMMILRVKDWTSGYRAFKREVFEKVGQNLDKYTGYTFQVAFLHRTIQAGFKISEVPLNFIDRKYGESKFLPLDYIINTLLYIFNNSSFIRYLIVGTVGFLIQTAIAKALISFKIHAGFSVTIGAEAAIISNFILNQFWTFSYKKIAGKKNLLKKFVQFNAASVISILIQGLVVTIGTTFFGQESWFIFMVLSIILFVIPYSYFVYHKIIWKEKR